MTERRNRYYVPGIPVGIMSPEFPKQRGTIFILCAFVSFAVSPPRRVPGILSLLGEALFLLPLLQLLTEPFHHPHPYQSGIGNVLLAGEHLQKIRHLLVQTH